ncbi:MAG TPA: PDZ domain-containing protein [Vicinamibacterales bacterium]|jgi:serine protease Do|nr:PDZ domain-containing protein [Vicinamibacterales bacterium]
MHVRASVLFILLSVGVVAAGQPGTAPGQTAAVDAALSKVAPSLVRIHVVMVDQQEGRELKREAAGSGTIITPEGHVLTNHHVAGRTRAIFCTLASREEVPADLVGTDPLSDIAILKLRPSSPRTFPAAHFGDVSKLKVGERVLALGSPLALSQSVTMGIVSNTEMIMPGMFWPFNRMTLDGEDVGSIVRWIGHDAPIFGGNSGGPLVNMQGEIVGVNEISLGLAGAIPADLAREVAEAIIKDGRVKRSWIGLEVQPLLKSYKGEKGGLVGGTIEGSPAEKAGFASGDVLLSIGSHDVTVRFAEEVPLFNQMVMRLPLRQPVTATVVRNGVEQTLTVTPVERESVEAPIHELATLGITGSNLTAWSSKELNRKTRDGVRVRGVRSGGPADDAKPALREDDIIVGVDDTPVKTLEGLTSALDHLVQNGNSHADALVSFERSGERLLTVVEIGRPGLEDPGLEARKAWIPISVQVLTRELADKLGLSDTSGVRVTRVLPGSAAKAGLQVGDIITAVDGDPVQASQPSDADLFATMIRQYKTGTNVELSIIRGKTPQKIKVALETSPRLPREMKKYEDPNFEFRVRDIAAADRLEEGIDPDQSGVLVDAVREGGWAALAHLAVGDLLLAVDGEAVQDVAAVQAKMTKIAAAHPPTVVFRVKRGIRTFFVEMQAGWKQQE